MIHQRFSRRRKKVREGPPRVRELWDHLAARCGPLAGQTPHGSPCLRYLLPAAGKRVNLAVRPRFSLVARGRALGCALLGLLEAVAVALDLEDFGAVDEAVDEGDRASGVREDLRSDDHAVSTAALYSLIASARLHGLDPEEYLRCLIRLVPLWPDDRMLELSPLFWAPTRARLDPKQLAAELGHLDVPSTPLDTSAPAEQKYAS